MHLRKRKKIAGIKRTAFILSLALVFVCGCKGTQTEEEDAAVSAQDTAREDEGSQTEYTRDIFAMDTYMSVTAYGSQAEEAVDAAVDEINRLDELLSVGMEESEITKLNKNGGGELSEDCVNLISCALDVYESTQGAYDITVYPLMELWGFTTQEFVVPDQEKLQETLELVGSGQLNLTEENGKTVLEMKKEGVTIDLGGIAKGYTSDRIIEIFENYDVTSGKINLGGNVDLYGTKTDGSKWLIAIQHPDDENGFLGVLSIEDQAVITSGGYERYFEEDGVTYHHILDPSTGYPANNGLVSVTIVSRNGMLADALSTSLYVMGTDKAMEYCKEHAIVDSFDAILYTDDGLLYATSGIIEDLQSDIEVSEIEIN